MPRCSSFLVVIVLLAFGFLPLTVSGKSKQFGKIKGRVVDVNDARIFHAEVLIVGEGLRWRLTTNMEGEFETMVPLGEYRVFVEANGFRGFASPKFEIKSSKKKSFNIEMQMAKPQMLVPAISSPTFVN
ncbi:MAG TPA: carboxypeptidase-like regulatory domain-containing protein [Pyrinomonadaceae bacterium]|jgi:hypothetical protein|nr:carboxypeptidase-like regulatory domain-containing protein [Pyrinomonadaceae bacterium]